MLFVSILGRGKGSLEDRARRAEHCAVHREARSGFAGEDLRIRVLALRPEPLLLLADGNLTAPSFKFQNENT